MCLITRQGIVMTRDEWTESCGNVLARAGVKHFHALEMADVGRETSAPVASLEAPSMDLMPHFILLSRILADVRAAVRVTPVLVNSWYRDAEYNRRIGGVENSMHMTGGAADIVKVGLTPTEVADILERHPDADKFGIGRYKTFTHIDIRGMITSPGWIGRRPAARW